MNHDKPVTTVQGYLRGHPHPTSPFFGTLSLIDVSRAGPICDGPSIEEETAVMRKSVGTSELWLRSTHLS